MSSSPPYAIPKHATVPGSPKSESQGPTSSPATSTNGQLSGRSPLASLTGIEVLGTGAFVPHGVVRNEDLAELGYDSDWIIKRTGIRERRRAADNQATSEIALEAAARCLEDAAVDADEVDLIVLATMTPDSPMPTTASLVQYGLGCRAPAIELNAACAGFVYALVTGMQFVHSGSSKCALVVGADLMSHAINPADPKTYPLFGDGAGAVLLGKGQKRQGLVSYTLGTEGDVDGVLCQPAGGTREPISPDHLSSGRHYIHMDGRAVFKWAVRVLADSTRDVLHHTCMTVDDIDLVVWHQANVRIIDAAAADLGIPRDKVLMNLERYGNTSAASIPLVLDEAARNGRLKRGDNVLLCGFGGGLAWGTGILAW